MNGVGINLQALADTGAHGYLFLSRSLANQLVKSLGISYQVLPYPLQVTGYDGKRTTRITHYLRLHLTIDGRRVYNAPFIVLDLGKHDCIIGVKFMRRFRLLLDPTRNRFRWPTEYPRTSTWARDILIKYRPNFLRTTDPYVQTDADRRDLAVDKDENRRRAGVMSIHCLASTIRRRPGLLPIQPRLVAAVSTVTVVTTTVVTDKKRTGTGWERSMKWKYERMNKELALVENPKIIPTRKRDKIIVRDTPVSPPNLDICMISANALHYNMKRPNTEFFQTSLYEISRVLDDREPMPDEDLDTLELIRKRLPKCYAAFRTAFSKTASNQLPPHRVYDHKIQLEQELVYGSTPLYRQSTDELRAMKEYLTEHLQRGFIAASNYPYASPVLFVKKPDGSLRFCIDYRKLNALTKKDSYPLPRIDELLARVSKAKVFTKLDIRQAFHRIRIDPESEDYTTFKTRYGTYKCKVLPFGLCNGPSTYQRYMNDVLMDYLDDFCMAYLDDILIYSEDPQEHEEHVKKVLRRLQEAGLQADIKKCEFSVERTKYLGYILTTKGLEVDPDKVEPLRNWVRPTTINGVKSFLGFCGFYRQFIRNFGMIAKPLTILGRPSEPFIWTPDCQEAFEELKQQLLRIQRIYHHDPELPTKLETDSSDGVIAGVFSQEHPDGKWYPIGFYSHVLNGHEPNWEIHDKELYAIVEAFRRWRPELMSTRSQIGVYTDHRSLEYFMTTKILTAKQVRWMEYLSDFNFKIMYTTGKSNLKADTLTRREQDLVVQEKIKLDSRSRVLLGPHRLDPRINAELAALYIASYPQRSVELMPIDTDALAKVPLDSDQLRTSLREDNRTSFEELRDEMPTEYSVEDGLLLYKGRLCVRRGTVLGTRLIQEVHTQPSTAHPGSTKTYQLLAKQYYWVGMEADVKRYVDNCIPCGYAHPRQTKQQGLLHPLPVPAYPWQHICMDFKEFNEDKHGYNMILVFIDRLGKDSVSIPCHKTIDARGMAQLYIQWVYRFGHTPETIISDRGPQFVSSFWNEFCRIIGVKVKLSTAYHKETDGQTEIMNRYIDQRLRPFVTYFQDNWSELIPIMDRAQMTLPHSTIGMTPYQLKHGVEPRNSWDWKSLKPATPIERLNLDEAVSLATRMHNVWQVAEENIKKAQESMIKRVNKHRRSIDWEPGDRVYLSTRNLKSYRPSRKLSSKFDGPYYVAERIGYGYRLRLPDGSKIHDIFSPDVLKKYPDNPLPGQEAPKPPSEAIAGKEEWEVDKILASRLLHGKLQYHVTWVGHDPDPTWYPASNFLGAPHKLRDYHRDYPDKPGPPLRLNDWIQAWEGGVEEYDHLVDDRAVGKSKKESRTRTGAVTERITRSKTRPTQE
jgi:predicted aspartyl protease